MRWNRISSISSFWFCVLALVSTLFLFFAVFVVEDSPFAASRPFKQEVIVAVVPLVIAMCVVFLSFLARGLNRVDAQDSEYYQFCVDEIDRFEASVVMLIQHRGSPRASKFSDAAHQHLLNASELFKKLVNGYRRKQVISRASASAGKLSGRLMELSSRDREAERKVARLLRKVESDPKVLNEIKAGFDRVFE